jgi:type I restriction enzyme R subunit
MNDYSEDSLVEQPAIGLFRELDWETANCFYEKFGEKGTLGRETSSQVVLVPRFAQRLWTSIPTCPQKPLSLPSKTSLATAAS